MTTPRPVWGADCPISMPLPSGDLVQVPMFGFGMSQFRLVHDITEAEYEALAVPVYAPRSGGLPVIADDAAIDAPRGALVGVGDLASPQTAVQPGIPNIQPIIHIPPASFRFPVVTLLGAAGTFGSLATATSTASGHAFQAVVVTGWGVGAGLAFFYATVMSDGQVALSTLPFTENELLPTMDHAELGVYDPARNLYYTNIIPTSTGATRAVSVFNNTLGGTDTGAGDLRQVFKGNTELLVSTQGGYYFNWDIGATGLYPVLAFYSKDASGNWSYNPSLSLTSTQWRNTNSSVYDPIIAGGTGQSTGINGTYWPTRTAGQMAVLPASGRTVVGHYFGTGANTGGAISVIDSAGNMLAAYQLPNIVPTSGPALTTVAVRDVESDPSSHLNDERFVIIYDQFPNTQQRCFQEFSYNETARTIIPKSVPVCPADTISSGGNVAPIFSIFGPDGTLYIAGGIGLGAGNMSVYLKHPSSGERNTVLNAPVFTGWPTASWPTPVRPDYSLGFPVSQGLGALAGPMAVDPVTGSVLVPGASGRFTAAIPVSAGLGGNLHSPVQSEFELPNNLIPDDQIFATSLGTWHPFLAVLSRVPPPVPAPAGTNVMQVTPGFGFEILSTGNYPVIPGHAYEAWVNVLSGSVSRTAEVWIQFFKADGSTSSIGSHVTATDNSSSWTLIKADATADSQAVNAQIWVQFDSAAEAHYVSTNSFFTVTAADLGWTGFVTNVTVTSSNALNGSFSLQVQAPFPNETVAAFGPKVPVTPYQEYIAKASFKTTAGNRTARVLIRWFDAKGIAVGLDTGGTLIVTATTTAWTEAWCSAMAPVGAVSAQIILEPTLVNANEIIYVDQISFQAQPFRSVPYVDFGLNALRTGNVNIISQGRPALSGRTLYIPVAQTFGAAEQAAYNAGGYVPKTKPQYLVALNLFAILGA